jgi:hypothetical protein
VVPSTHRTLPPSGGIPFVARHGHPAAAERLLSGKRRRHSSSTGAISQLQTYNLSALCKE